MSLTPPPIITVPWASSGLKNSIPPNANNTTGNAGYAEGFPAVNMTPKVAGGIPPFGKDFNGIFFDITQILQYMQAGGNTQYSSALSAAIGGYPAGALLSKSSGVGLWRNTVDNNTSNPDAGGAGWYTDSAVGVIRSLSVSASGTSALISVSFGLASLESTSTSSPIEISNFSGSASVSSSGLNGLDTGSLAANTWYSVWVISNGISTGTLLSASSTSPTMPAGYTYRRRVGWARTDSTANKYPLSFIQKGCRAQYVVAAGSNVPSVRAMASGVAGSTSIPTWVPVSTAAFIPPTATEVGVSLSVYSGSSAQAFCAPNQSYGSHASTNPPPVSFTQSTGQATGAIPASFILETSSIFWASTSASAILYCTGWSDSL